MNLLRSRMLPIGALCLFIVVVNLLWSDALLDTARGFPWSWMRLNWFVKTKLGTNTSAFPNPFSNGIVETNNSVVELPADQPHLSATGLFIWPERKLEKLDADNLAAIAGTVDLVLRDTRERHVRAILKENNPNVRLIGYLNAIWAWKYDDYMWQWSEISQRTDWFLKDSKGRRILSACCDNPTNMDPGNAAWQEYLAEAVLRGLSEGLDGVYLDDVHEMVPAFYYKDVWPINPRTRRLYSDDEWRIDTLGLVQHVYARIRESYPDATDKLVLYNGYSLSSGLAPTFLDWADGIMFEGFVHPYWESSSDMRPEWQWKEELDALVSFQQRGKLVFAVSGTGDGDHQSMNMFTYASYLLGKGSRSFYNYTDFDIVGPLWAGFLAPIGEPLGDYYRAESVYQRDFTAAKVLVNPTSRPYQVELPDSYYRMSNDGSIAPRPIDSLIMRPYTGAILLSVNAYSPN